LISSKKKIKRVLFIDALNSYYRAYIVDPSLSTNGQPIGGLKGFLKILQKLCRDIKPDRIVVCWDGAGGSRRRKSVNKNYKEGRNPIRLNRTIRNLTENQELQNKIWQQTRLVEYLSYMPVAQLMFESIEADDLIAFACQLQDYAGWQKVIVSSDKDFIQVLDKETVLYRPTQEEVLNVNRVVDEYGIHPNNFALARAIAGDKNDNLPGVKGVGLATVKKRFPFMKEKEEASIARVLHHCQENIDGVKAFSSILGEEKLVRENYKLMQLSSPNISVNTKMKIRSIIEKDELFLNKTEIIKMMTLDGFGESSWSDLFQRFNKILIDK
tara:strand:- start:508 stop:1485 length:978 start_codon:yes stop_codon:yes gene_type:complete